MNSEKFGEIISECRKDKKMSRKELAESIGCSVTTIWQWEHGEKTPKFENVVALEKILETEILTNKFMETAGGE